MPDESEGKLIGRVDKYDCMLWSASIADPGSQFSFPVLKCVYTIMILYTFNNVQYRIP